jgi:hypothetical protein|uniref:Zinc finger BED domain-containing protein 5 n=1 Tax=Sipha flava TaxID=143950 RepID=A0A2S2QVB3_9HEMI
MYAKLISKLEELNLYLQRIQGADIFAVHDKIKGFMKKLTLWQNNIEKQNDDCFETYQIFITKNDIKLAENIINHISLHLISSNKHRNKLNLSNTLRLKITKIDVDVNAVINRKRKQAHTLLLKVHL